MQPPTIPADLRLRTHLLVWGARVLVIGAGGLLALLAYLNTLAALYPAAPELAAARFHRLTLLVAGVLVVLTSGVAGLCSYQSFGRPHDSEETEQSHTGGEVFEPTPAGATFAERFLVPLAPQGGAA